jgi:hypothetical protein
VNESTPCDLHLTSSAIAPFDTDGTPSINYRYQAEVYCNLEKTTYLVYTDAMDAVVGRAFLKAVITTNYSTATEQFELQVLTALIGNAQGYAFVIGGTNRGVPESFPPIPFTKDLVANQPPSGVPPCPVSPNVLGPTTALDAQSTLNLSISDDGKAFKVAPGADITVSLPPQYAVIISQPPPGLTLISQRSSSQSISYRFRASGLPGGQLEIRIPDATVWSVGIGVA